MFQDFKTFALKGTVVDLAIGVIIGAAFGAIVASMVGDVIMPIVGAASGGLDFSNYYLPLNASVKTGLPLADAKKAGAVLAYGNFITVTINLLVKRMGNASRSRLGTPIMGNERAYAMASADAMPTRSPV